MRTVGGHRRIPVSEAVQFVRSRGVVLRRPELLGFHGVEETELRRPLQPEAADFLCEALRRDDRAAAIATIVGTFLDGGSVAAICDGPLRESMGRIGELWQHGAEGIMIEHRAVSTCVEALCQLRAALPRSRANAPTAVGGAIAGDPYVLPSFAISLSLAEAGFREVNLGADVPEAALLRAVEFYRPHLVWQSASTAADASTLRRRFARLAERLHPMGIPLVVGGRVAASAATVGIAGLVHLSCARELAAFAQGLARASEDGRKASRTLRRRK